jgi:hypothetical protein
VGTEKDAKKIAQELWAAAPDALFQSLGLNAKAWCPRWLVVWMRRCRVANKWTDPRPFQEDEAYQCLQWVGGQQ